MAVRELEPRTLEVPLPPMRLWRDDLEQIESVIREAAAEVSILTDRYQLDRIADLAQVKESRIKGLHLLAAEGRIQLVIKDSGGLLRILDPTLPERGMAADIAQISRRCRKFGAGGSRFQGVTFMAVATVSLFVAALVTTIAMVAFGMEWAKREALPPHLAWLVVPSGAVCAILGHRYASNVIYTRTRAENPPWMKRNADALATNAIVSAVFLFLGIWIGKLTS